MCVRWLYLWSSSQWLTSPSLLSRVRHHVSYISIHPYAYVYTHIDIHRYTYVYIFLSRVCHHVYVRTYSETHTCERFCYVCFKYVTCRNVFEMCVGMLHICRICSLSIEHTDAASIFFYFVLSLEHQTRHPTRGGWCHARATHCVAACCSVSQCGEVCYTHFQEKKGAVVCTGGWQRRCINFTGYFFANWPYT